MKIKSAVIAISLCLITSIGVNAQKMKVKGDMSSLKDVSKIDLEFTYDNMSVGKYDSEDEYLQERVEKKNEKEPGTGNEWREAWVNDREE